MPLDQTIASLRGHLTRSMRTAFLSCFLSGYLVHLFVFTNIIPNSDGLSRVFDLQQMTISGRWMLHYASFLHCFTQSPGMIGLLSMILLSLSAMVVVSLLHLQSPSLAALAGIFMAAFPAMGYTFLYTFTASAYCLSIFLAILSVKLATLPRWGILWAILSLALSMGIYQAYAALAVSLSILLVMRECFSHFTNWKHTFGLGLRLMAFLLAGALLYYGILQLFLQLKGLELLDYLGMSQADSGYPISQLPRLIFSIYKQVAIFLFLPGSSSPFTTPWLALLHLILLSLSGFYLLLLFTRSPLPFALWRLLGVFSMAALLPLGVGFAQLLSPFADATPIMKYPYVLLYMASLLVAELGSDLLPKPKAARIFSSGFGLVLLSLIFYYANLNNLLYTASAQAHRATLSYATRLLSRIESTPGYTGQEPIVVIGSFPTDRIYAQIPSYSLIDHYSVPMHTVAPLNKHIYYYWRDWLNVPIDEPEESLFKTLALTPAFQAMPLYPADGSIQWIEGNLVVKLQEHYTPKQNYEIAYENRS